MRRKSGCISRCGRKVTKRKITHSLDAAMQGPDGARVEVSFSLADAVAWKGTAGLCQYG